MPKQHEPPSSLIFYFFFKMPGKEYHDVDKMRRADWTCWLIVLAVSTLASGQQNHVDLHEDDHNPMGCDCMEYWACITRYYLLLFQVNSFMWMKTNESGNFSAEAQPIVTAVTWTRACVATCREAPDQSVSCPSSTSQSADVKVTWPLPLAIANEPTDSPI